MKEAPQGRLRIPLSRRFFAQITPKNCPKFMFTPSVPNHAGCQIDHSRNNAVIFIQLPFSCFKICRITPSRVPLLGPHRDILLRQLAFFFSLEQIEELILLRKSGSRKKITFSHCDYIYLKIKNIFF